MTVIGNFPISTLAAFPGLGLTHSIVHALVEQISARDGSRSDRTRPTIQRMGCTW